MFKADPNALPDEVVANRDAQKEARVLGKTITGKKYPQKVRAAIKLR